MRKFQIQCVTDSYHAARDSRFQKGKTSYIVGEFDSLNEAYKGLLGLFSDKAGIQFNNWGLAVIWKGDDSLDAYPTYQDGMRGFRYDVYEYSIGISDKWSCLVTDLWLYVSKIYEDEERIKKSGINTESDKVKKVLKELKNEISYIVLNEDDEAKRYDMIDDALDKAAGKLLEN